MSLCLCADYKARAPHLGFPMLVPAVETKPSILYCCKSRSLETLERPGLSVPSAIQHIPRILIGGPLHLSLQPCANAVRQKPDLGLAAVGRGLLVRKRDRQSLVFYNLLYSFEEAESTV